MHFTDKPWLSSVEEIGESFAIRFGNFGLANYTGLFGLLILILLLIISNDYSLRRLKALKWKNLQRFTYPLFILVIAHSVHGARIGEVGQGVKRIWQTSCTAPT